VEHCATLHNCAVQQDAAALANREGQVQAGGSSGVVRVRGVIKKILQYILSDTALRFSGIIEDEIILDFVCLPQ
jgi:hypothetical protein